MNATQTKKDFAEEVGEIVGYTQEYVDAKIKIATLDFAEKTARVGSTVATSAVIFALIPTLITLLCIGLAFFLSSTISGLSTAGGFFVISLALILLLSLLYIFRQRLLTNPFIDSILSIIYEPTKK